MRRQQAPQSGLYPPIWMRGLYHALALPFVLLALAATAAPFVLRVDEISTLLFAPDSPLGAVAFSIADSPRAAVIPIVVIVGVVATGLLAFGVILIFGGLIRTAQRRANAELDDAGAARGPFVLYLRPFVEDRRSFVRNHYGETARFMYGIRIPLEAAFALALHPERRLIAVGDKFSSIGAAKMTVDDARWFEVVQDLAAAADAVIMVPGYRGATAQEVDFLFSQPDLLRKTIFVQPECSEGDAHWRDWRAYVESARTRGIPLPAPALEGQIFFGAADASLAAIPLGVLNRKRLRGLIERAASGRLHTVGQDAESSVVDELDTFSVRRVFGVFGFGLLGWSERVGPRATIGTAMALLVGSAAALSMFSFARAAEIDRQRADNPVFAAYYPCVWRHGATQSQQQREECRLAAVLTGERILLQNADALIDADPPVTVRAYNRVWRAFRTFGPARPRRTEAGERIALEAALRWNAVTPYALRRAGIAEPASHEPGALLNQAEALPWDGYRESEFFRDAAADALGLDYLLNSPTRTFAERAATLQHVHERVSESYMRAGEEDRALSRARRRLVVLLVALEQGASDAATLAALEDAIVALDRHPAHGAPWDVIDVALQRIELWRTWDAASAEQLRRVRALVLERAPPLPPIPR